MKRSVLYIVLCLIVGKAVAQEPGTGVKARILSFHQQLVKGNDVAPYLDDSLSYGHSNGWIETKAELVDNLGSRLTYHAVTEDSVKVAVNGPVAHIRFVGDFDVSLNGKRSVFRLRVLEVWVLRDEGWKIFARQAIR